jgi:hypothetical protein
MIVPVKMNKSKQESVVVKKSAGAEVDMGRRFVATNLTIKK